VISTTVSFDRERQREYSLSVTATDLAQEPLIGICQITILIADQNDNDPKFENSRYQCKSHLCHSSVTSVTPWVISVTLIISPLSLSPVWFRQFHYQMCLLVLPCPIH
jgi:hypothetical protein